MPEARMRLLEKNQYSSSLEKNILRSSTYGSGKGSGRPTVELAPKILIPASADGAGNPFYDKTKNPFGDDEDEDVAEEAGDDKQLGGNSGEYDDNLNPFA